MRALITGGAGVLGREICFLLHKQGYDIHIADAKDVGEFDTAINDIIENYIQIDFSNPVTISEWLNDEYFAKSDYDVLIINAFPRLFGNFSEYSAQDLQSIVSASFTSQLMLVNQVLRSMLSRNKGRIIIIGSKAALFGYSRGSMYCSMKAAWRSWYESVSRELKTTNPNINVSLIHPDSFSQADGRKLESFDAIIKICLQSIQKALFNPSKEYYALHFKSRFILSLRILLNALKMLFK